MSAHALASCSGILYYTFLSACSERKMLLFSLLLPSYYVLMWYCTALLKCGQYHQNYFIFSKNNSYHLIFLSNKVKAIFLGIFLKVAILVSFNFWLLITDSIYICRVCVSFLVNFIPHFDHFLEQCSCLKEIDSPT